MAKKAMPWIQDEQGMTLLLARDENFLGSFQGLNDDVEALPVPRSTADAAVYHEGLRMFSHLRVEIIHQHSQRSFGQPAFRDNLTTARGADNSGGIVSWVSHDGAGLKKVSQYIPEYV